MVNSATTTKEGLRGSLPGSILFAGSLLWKIVGSVSNVDFLMSIPNERFRTLFELFMNVGVWILLGFGLLWAFLAYKNPRKQTYWPEMVVAVGVISFIWGVLLTVYATGSVPRIILSWGANGPICRAVLDTSRLVGFRKQYDVAIICGIIDPGMDKYKDTRITVSSAFTIAPHVVPIEVPHSKEMADLVEARKAKGAQALTIWHEAVLIPKGIEMAAIHSVADVSKYGGKILEQGYFE